MKSPALELAGVSKVYELGGTEIVALDHVDLTVDADEVVTLLGPSGSGKSTLLSIAGGLLSASSGRVVVGGQDITRANSRKLTAFRRKRVGFIFQSVNLVPFLTARENLLVVAQLARRRPSEAKRRADRLLEELGLGHRVGNLPAQLSGGERQRVAIGRALMNQPALVLVDEPTSALDSDRGQQVMQLIVSEVKARGAAAVIVTHDARMTRYGDRILNMADGRIAGIEPRPEWTRNRPEEPATIGVAPGHEGPERIRQPAPGPAGPAPAVLEPDHSRWRRPDQPAAPLLQPPLRTTNPPLQRPPLGGTATPLPRRQPEPTPPVHRSPPAAAHDPGLPQRPRRGTEPLPPLHPSRPVAPQHRPPEPQQAPPGAGQYLEPDRRQAPPLGAGQYLEPDRRQAPPLGAGQYRRSRRQQEPPATARPDPALPSSRPRRRTESLPPLHPSPPAGAQDPALPPQRPRRRTEPLPRLHPSPPAGRPERPQAPLNDERVEPPLLPLQPDPNWPRRETPPRPQAWPDPDASQPSAGAEEPPEPIWPHGWWGPEDEDG